MAVKEMRGLRFSKLLVVARAGRLNDGTAVWTCKCDCGAQKDIPGNKLRAGLYKSCGCSSPRFTKEALTTHGMSRTRTYRIWQGMKRRCSAFSGKKELANYFNRGIRVCDRWHDFNNFLEDMGQAPDGLSIDRINVNGNYEPANCRWATATEQANNTTVNVIVSYSGEKLTLSQLARKLDIKANTFLYRLKRGIPIERAVQKKIGYLRKSAQKNKTADCSVERT